MSLGDTFLKIFFRIGFDLFWCLWKLFLAVFRVVFIHRCTWVENPGGSSNFCQNPWGGGQNCQGVPYVGLYYIFISKFFENLPGGVVSSPLRLPPRASMSLFSQMTFPDLHLDWYNIFLVRTAWFDYTYMNNGRTF